jgi:hypothetical protein
MRRFVLLLVASAFFLCAPFAKAQGTAMIVGTVADSSGPVILSAHVTVIQVGTGMMTSVTANAQGYFVFPSLQPATYDLTVEESGFKKYVQTGIVLLANQSVTVNMALQVGQLSQQVNVSGAAPLVNTTNAAVGQVVEQTRMVELPLNGRNAAQLTSLVAGISTVPATFADANQGNQKTFPEAVVISSNGSQEGMVNFLLDGANNVDIYTVVNQPFPFPDALQEFSVQTNNYAPQFGANAGAVVNVVTKSGTNAIHGDGFEFVRNAVFNSRNFFAAQRDQLKRNQYGGTIGGPLSIPGLYNGHDRTFFFLGYQGTVIKNIAGGSSATVPTNAEINGDFSAITASIKNPHTGVAYAGNQIPTTSFDPASVKVLNYLPRATGSGLIFFPQPGISQHSNEVVGRLDHEISSKDRLTGRYLYGRFTNAPFYDPINILTFTDGSTIVSQNYLVHETHIFKSNLLNELRLGFSRIGDERGPGPGVPSVKDFGVQNICQPPNSSVGKTINISGYFKFGNNPKADFIRNSYNFADDFSWVTGRHQISMGASFDRSQVNINNAYNQSGNFSFTSTTTGNAMASFFLGYLRTFSQGAGEYYNNRNSFIGMYFADRIHAPRKLTLDLGVRYEPARPWADTRGRVEEFLSNNFYSGSHSSMYTNAPAGLLFPGDTGMPNRGVRSDNNIAPRVGFAYDLTGSGTTSIRGGAGIFYNTRGMGVIGSTFADLSPWSPQISLTTPAGPFSNPLLGVTNPFPAPFPPPKTATFPSPVLVATYDPGNGFPSPVTYQWNLQFQHQFSAEWLLRIGYVGSRSTQLGENVDLNPAHYIAGSNLSTDARRTFVGYSDIYMQGQDATSNYHSLQVTLQKRLATHGPMSGMSWLANYTYAKSMDDTPYGTLTNGGLGNPGSASVVPFGGLNRHQMDYGPSIFDQTQSLVLSYVWQMPKLESQPAAVRGIFGKWEYTGIITSQSGTPMTILAGTDQSLTGLATDRAVQVGSAYGHGACGSSAPCVGYLIPGSFALPATGTYGNTGKNSLRGPGLTGWDMGLFKNFPLHSERYSLQFRAEFFNAFNWTNFSNPISSVASAGFGSINAAGDPRIGQLALKLFS